MVKIIEGTENGFSDSGLLADFLATAGLSYYSVFGYMRYWTGENSVIPGIPTYETDLGPLNHHFDPLDLSLLGKFKDGE